MLSKEGQLYFGSILAPGIQKTLFSLKNLRESILIHPWSQCQMLIERICLWFVCVAYMSDVLEWQHDLHFHFSERIVFFLHSKRQKKWSNCKYASVEEGLDVITNFKIPCGRAEDYYGLLVGILKVEMLPAMLLNHSLL